MGSIITLGLHSLKLLFKSKSLLIVLFLMPLALSALITFGLQKVYVPAVSYLKTEKSFENEIKTLSGKAKEAGIMFKEQSKLYPEVKKQLDNVIDRDVPEVAEYATQNFLSVLLPPYYPATGKIIDNTMISLNTLLVIIFSISWLPAMFGVFLMNQDKKNKTLIPIIAQGISSSQYILSKCFAGLLISLFIAIASVSGYFLGAGSAQMNIAVIQNIAIVSVIGSFCAITISILLSQIISEYKTQVLICGMLVPILVISLFIAAIQAPLIDSSITEIKAQFSVIKNERIPQDKKKFDLLGERQIYDYAQMFAVKLGSEIIPSGVQSLPKRNKATFSDSMLKALNTFSIVSIICIILSMGLSLITFRKQ